MGDVKLGGRGPLSMPLFVVLTSGPLSFVSFSFGVPLVVEGGMAASWSLEPCAAVFCVFSAPVLGGPALVAALAPAPDDPALVTPLELSCLAAGTPPEPVLDGPAQVRSLVPEVGWSQLACPAAADGGDGGDGKDGSVPRVELGLSVLAPAELPGGVSFSV